MCKHVFHLQIDDFIPDNDNNMEDDLSSILGEAIRSGYDLREIHYMDMFNTVPANTSIHMSQ
jgi:hypothetical protein